MEQEKFDPTFKTYNPHLTGLGEHAYTSKYLHLVYVRDTIHNQFPDSDVSSHDENIQEVRRAAEHLGIQLPKTVDLEQAQLAATYRSILAEQYNLTPEMAENIRESLIAICTRAQEGVKESEVGEVRKALLPPPSEEVLVRLNANEQKLLQLLTDHLGALVPFEEIFHLLEWKGGESKLKHRLATMICRLTKRIDGYCEISAATGKGYIASVPRSSNEGKH